MLEQNPGDSSDSVATFCRVRSGLPLPFLSLGVALLTAGALAALALSGPVSSGSAPAPTGPGAVQIGGEQPPMEFSPGPSTPAAVKLTPSPPSAGPVAVTPPPHSNPVVTPEAETPRESVAGTTVVPTAALPPVPSEALPIAPSSVPWT
ncbi:hypothetical protein GCM10017774_84710 [Lentzea cavernae]|uniref:Uncharacterized protein n=2 Tax=Lentzea cavernae TaxID=2020703 RepID=A0ABQ3MSC8_9PSEU|nr:hypothetical protein GCM10017774_84710 [Lentzea cavernae]